MARRRGRPPRDAHGAPLVRQRSHRLWATEASAVLSSLFDAAKDGYAHCSVHEVWASTLAATLLSCGHPVLEQVSASVGSRACEALAWRAAGLRKDGNEPPLEMWGDSSKWSTRFRTQIRHRLCDVRRVAAQARRVSSCRASTRPSVNGASTRGSSRGGTQSVVTASSVVSRSSPAVGMLACAFADDPVSVPRFECRQ